MALVLPWTSKKKGGSGMEHGMQHRRLYRSTRNRVFAGVCGGLGEYLQIDPGLLRIIWLLIVVFTGFVPGLLAYIIAIFIVPLEPSRY